MALFVIMAVPTSYFLIDKFAFVTPGYFTDLISALRDYFIALGATLIGAGAIAFSFIMFASQINVERMPHHLFWRFSFDKRIISAFIGIFTIAVSTASFSLVVSERYDAPVKVVEGLIAEWSAGHGKIKSQKS